MAEEVEKLDGKDYRIEVIKNTKGYQWSIRVLSNDIEEAKKKTEELELWCSKTYGAKE
jgi:hypothetical protein